MEYYIFTDDGGSPKVTGIKTGTGQAWFDDNFWFKNEHIKRFMWSDDRRDLRFLSGIQPEFSLDLFGLTMHKDAKHTDLIYLSSLLNGFIVSSKFRSLLEKFKLPPHKYYYTTFYQFDKKTRETKEITGYWWLYFQKETGENTVNFSKSKFDTSFHIKYLNLEENTLNVNSYEDYMDIFYKGFSSLNALELVFNKNFDKDLDLWGCRFLSVKNYVSERLLNAINENNISGFRVISSESLKESARITGKSWCKLFFE